MAAMIWTMEHFGKYLRGRHFTVFSDHKPLETQGENHKINIKQNLGSIYAMGFQNQIQKGE
jgi:hypothetical protein